MGLAYGTVLGYLSDPGSTLTAVDWATGDSPTVRSFGSAATAKLLRVGRAGATSGGVRVTSPALHDVARGIQFTSGENPAVFLMPQEIGQPLVSQDTLSVELSGGTHETDLVTLGIYYSDVSGIAARLHNWADFSSLITQIKPLEVDCTSNATAGQWEDTVITTTEDLLHANTDYAVLGYITDVVVSVVGLLGQETGNLRVCGPGTTATDDTSDFFVEMSAREGLPLIPVINSANKGAIYASVADVGTSTAVKVQLILAELSQNLSS